MPPRRIRAPQQQSAAAKVFKLFCLLALALGFKVLLAAALRAYSLHPGHQRAQDLAAAGQAAGLDASAGAAAKPVLKGEDSGSAAAEETSDDGVTAEEYLGTETPAQVLALPLAQHPSPLPATMLCPPTLLSLFGCSWWTA
jgi:hypothetical protein